MIKKLILPLLVLTAGSAFASFNFTLSNAVQSTYPGGYADPFCASFSGQCVIFNGTIPADLVNDTFINGIQVDFDLINNPSPTALTENDNFFFAYPITGPPGTIFPGDPDFIGRIFEIDVDPSAPFGIYHGTITLLGDFEPNPASDPFGLTPLLSLPFEIDVVPEPSTWALLLGGLTAFAAIAWKRRATSVRG